MYIYVCLIHLSMLVWKKKIHQDIYTSVTSCSLYPLVFPNITSVCLLSFSLYKWIQMKRSEVSGSKLDDTFDVCVFGTSFWQMMVMRWWWWWQVRGPFSCCFMDRWVAVTWGYSDLIFSGMINEVCSFMQGKWALQELLFYVVCHSWSIHLSIYRLSCLHLRRRLIILAV